MQGCRGICRLGRISTNGAPFSNIIDRNGSVIPGTESHGIFPYARTATFGINDGYYYARFSVRF